MSLKSRLFSRRQESRTHARFAGLTFSRLCRRRHSLMPQTGETYLLKRGCAEWAQKQNTTAVLQGVRLRWESHLQ